MEMNYGDPETVNYNLWNIPTDNGAIPGYIAIKAPENWSGTIPDMSFNVVMEENGESIGKTFDATVDPVVDPMTIAPTKTFGSEGEEIALKLNANVQDLDGSEVVKLSLKGLGEHASFKVDGDYVKPDGYDADSDTYTFDGIAALDINKMTVVQSAMDGTVEVKAQTIEQGTDPVQASAEQSGSFQITIHEALPSAGDDTFLYTGKAIDGDAGFDTVVLPADTESIDFSNLANIEKIDLTLGDHDLGTLTLEDVMDMTDEHNELTIVGDNSGDKVTFDKSAGWQKGDSSNGYTDYSNADHTVTVHVDDHIYHHLG
jgi:hypothetical protein